jgi:glycosyltransferase involved in cell wall biosynthesis
MNEQPVLHLISSVGFFGAENVMLELATKLAHTPFKPIIGVFNNVHNPHLGAAQEAKERDLEVRVFPCKGKFDIKAIYTLKKFLSQHNVKIIHSHGYKSNFYGFAAALAKNIKLVATCHNWLGTDPKMRFYAWIDKKTLFRFDKIIAVSQEIHKELLRHAIPSDKIALIPNGISLNRFQNKTCVDALRKEFAISNDCKVIGTVGRLTEEKGHNHLLEAAEKILSSCPNTVFLIVGDGPLRQQLEAQSSKLPVVFTGVRNDLPALYSLMDLFVLPSLNEGLPMVLLEAMASKKPIVATSVGEIPRVLQHEKSGIIIPPGKSDLLADAILSLLSSEKRAQELTEHGFRDVELHYSSETMAGNYLQIYKELVGETVYV